jgi:hypothetical protein
MILPLDKPILLTLGAGCGFCSTSRSFFRIVGIVRNDNEKFVRINILAADHAIMIHKVLSGEERLEKRSIKSWELAGELLLFLGYKYRTPLLASMVSNTYTEAGHGGKSPNNELVEKR